MNQPHVLHVLDALESAGIPTLLEGGWAVDALLGRQTRRHRDLDIAVDVADLDRTRLVLEGLGLRHDASKKPDLPAKFVMASDGLGEVDVHPLVFDAGGNGWQLLSRSGAWGLYSAEGLRGIGIIGNRRVRCTTADQQVRHRLGYPLRDDDVHDLRLLREEFGVAVHPSCDEGWTERCARLLR